MSKKIKASEELVNSQIIKVEEEPVVTLENIPFNVQATCTSIQKNCIVGEVKNIGALFVTEIYNHEDGSRSEAEFAISSPDLVYPFEEGKIYQIKVFVADKELIAE